MRVLVTGGSGKVGSHAADALRGRGHDVVLTDIAPPVYGPQAGRFPYIRADLTDFGAAVGTVMKVRPEAVVHAAGIPSAQKDPPSVIFSNNVLAMFHVAEAIARTGVGRLVYVSSETVPGYVTAEVPDVPDYLPVDEQHPVRPQDAYALSKSIGESICDALVRRSDARAVSIRASFVVAEADYPRVVPVPEENVTLGRVNLWSYVDAVDLAELIALAVEADSVGHEVVYAAQPDNLVGRPLGELLDAAFGANAPTLRTLDRADSSGLSCAKAASLFGWRPTRSWRDHLPPAST